MKDFFGHIKKSILGATTVLMFFLLQFLWYVFDAERRVPMWLLMLTIILCYLVCIIVYAAASGKRETQFVLPKVRRICTEEGKFIFLVEKNELYTNGSYVSIYYQDEDSEIETILGIGYVETVNSQGNMQIVFRLYSEGKRAVEILSKMEDRKKYRDALRIRPTITKDILEED